MKVILLEDVKKIGKKGDVVDLNDAYARNVIISKKSPITTEKIFSTKVSTDL